MNLSIGPLPLGRPLKGRISPPADCTESSRSQGRFVFCCLAAPRYIWRVGLGRCSMA